MIDFLLPLVSGLALLVHHHHKYGIWFHKVGRRPMFRDHGTLSIILTAVGMVGLAV